MKLTQPLQIKHSYPFDPTFGYTLEQLLQIQNPPHPADFEAFWNGIHEKVRTAPLRYTVERELWSPVPHTKIYLIRFTNWDGASIGMWLARPDHSTGSLLIGQGYGHCTQPLAAEENGLTIAFPSIRGLGLSQCKDIPWDRAKHALHGIEKKETYVITGAVADHWMSLRVMTDMFPDTADHVAYSGSSLGGGMGAITSAFEPLIRSAEINVPNFGGKAVLNCAIMPEDSGEQRRRYILAHPESDTMDYMDASAAARFLKIPVLITPALFDPSNPPPGQFAVANAIPEQYRILRIREVGHFAATPHDTEMQTELDQIRKKLGITK